MITKLKSSEYLKGYEQMTDAERKDYRKRVGEWLACNGSMLMRATDRPMAKSQNITVLVRRWDKNYCEAFLRGVELLSALVGVTDTMLPSQLYVRSVYRVTRHMISCLTAVAEGGEFKAAAGGNGDGIASQQKKTSLPAGGAPAGTRTGTAGAGTARAGAAATKTDNTVTGQPKKPLPTIKTVRVQREVVPAHQPSAAGAAETTETAAGAAGVAGDARPVPVRPRHIDQYVYLLPKSTQEKAAKVKQLLTDLDYAREKVRLLMDAPQASQSDRAAWASKATKIDSQVGAIYRELDAEWAKLVESGRVTVDDMGNAHVIESEQGKVNGEKSATAQESFLLHDATQASQSAERTMNPEPLTTGQKARRRDLRKFLTDTRRGNGKTREEHLKKWNEAFKAYLALEPIEKAMKDEKILAAMEHYGLVLTDAAKATMKGEG